MQTFVFFFTSGKVHPPPLPFFPLLMDVVATQVHPLKMMQFKNMIQLKTYDFVFCFCFRLNLLTSLAVWGLG